MAIKYTFLFLLVFSTQLLAEEPASSTIDQNLRIIFLGDSLTAGYGLERDNAYPFLVEDILNNKGFNVEVVNGGVSGDTTAGGLRRLDWVMAKRGDILVVVLGANDGLRGLSLGETKKNLAAIVDRAREIYPDISIAIVRMEVPPTMGASYSSSFSEIFPAIAKEKNITLFPFLLEGVAGDPSLNQKDGIHPTIEGQKIIADAMAKNLLGMISKRREEGITSP